MANKIIGYIEKIDEVMELTPTFRKREFVLRTEEEVNGNLYENYIVFQCVNNQTAITDPFRVGDRVAASFSFRGQKFMRKKKDGKDLPESEQTLGYITTLQAWKLEPIKQQYQPMAQPQMGAGGIVNYSNNPPAADNNMNTGLGGADGTNGFDNATGGVPGTNGNSFYNPNPEAVDDLPF